MNKIVIKISCGLGDSITYLARLPELCRKEKVDTVDAHITGGIQNVRSMIVDLYSVSDKIHGITSNDVNPNNYNKVLNWLPANNPLEYDITIPTITPFGENNNDFANSFLENIKNPIIVNPYTLSGSHEAISRKHLRSGKEEFWSSLIIELEKNKFTPIIIGGMGDIIDWKSYGCDPIVLYREHHHFLDTVALIQKSIATVGTDSWPWEVSYYAGKPTVSINLVNHNFFDLHVGKNTDNLLICRTAPKIEDIVSFLKAKVFNGEKQSIKTT